MEGMCILQYKTKSFLKEKEQLVEVYATIENTGNMAKTIHSLVLATKNNAKVIPEVYEILKEESEKRSGVFIENYNVFLVDLRESVQTRVDELFSAHPELLIVE